MSDKWKVFAILAVAIVMAAIGEALASKGMKKLDPHAGFVSQLMNSVADPHVISGTLLMVGYVLLYVWTLGRAELSYVLPLSAASYIIGTCLSKWYLHEDVKPARWIGTAVVVTGVLIVAIWGSSSGGSGGNDKSSSGGKAAEPSPTHSS